MLNRFELENKLENVPYSRELAASILSVCYKQYGANIDKNDLLHSVVERELQTIPDVWNVGLFRLLDEAIFLAKTVGFASITVPMKDNRRSAQTILAHQIVTNILAVRSLSALGLDLPSRQNLRALYEMCIALCRSLIDIDFCDEFRNQATPELANEFWHKYIKGQRSEKYLDQYNKGNDHKCLLLLSLSDDDYKLLGVSAHPSFFGWIIDWQADFEGDEGKEQMFFLSPKNSTEKVLVLSTQLILLTLQFAAPLISKTTLSADFVTKHPLFEHCEDDVKAIESIGSISGFMFLMLAKWSNRNKPDFDPEIHF